MLVKEDVYLNGVINNVLYPGSFDKFHRETEKEFAWTETVYIKQVIYNNPCTIVVWNDGTKTIAKCHPQDKYSAETGLLTCIMKKLKGSNGFRNLINTWVPDMSKTTDKEIKRTLRDVRNSYK